MSERERKTVRDRQEIETERQKEIQRQLTKGDREGGPIMDLDLYETHLNAPILY